MDDIRSYYSLFNDSRSKTFELLSTAPRRHCLEMLSQFNNLKQKIDRENESYLRYAKKMEIDLVNDKPFIEKDKYRRNNVYRQHFKLTRLNKVIIFKFDVDELKNIILKANEKLRKVLDQLKIQLASHREKYEDIQMGYAFFTRMCCPTALAEGKCDVSQEHVVKYFNKWMLKRNSFIQKSIVSAENYRQKIHGLKDNLTTKEELGEEFTMVDYMKMKIIVNETYHELEEKIKELAKHKMIMNKIIVVVNAEKTRHNKLQAEVKKVELAYGKLLKSTMQLEKLTSVSQTQIKILETKKENLLRRTQGVSVPETLAYLEAILEKKGVEKSLRCSQSTLRTIKRDHDKLVRFGRLREVGY